MSFGHAQISQHERHWLRPSHQLGRTVPAAYRYYQQLVLETDQEIQRQMAELESAGTRSLYHAKDYMGEFFRRICRKLGRPQAITATAHKLARIAFHLLSTGEPYNESVFHRCEEEALKRAEMRLRKQATHLEFRINPAKAD